MEVRRAVEGASGTAHQLRRSDFRPQHLDRPGYPAISRREMPYRLVAFTEHGLDMRGLGFEPDTVGYSGTEVIFRPTPPSSSLQPLPATWTEPDDIITANTLLRADMRNDDDNRSLDEVRHGCSSSPTRLRLRHKPAQLNWSTYLR